MSNHLDICYIVTKLYDWHRRQFTMLFQCLQIVYTGICKAFDYMFYKSTNASLLYCSVIIIVKHHLLLISLLSLIMKSDETFWLMELLEVHVKNFVMWPTHIHISMMSTYMYYSLIFRKIIKIQENVDTYIPIKLIILHALLLQWDKHLKTHTKRR